MKRDSETGQLDFSKGQALRDDGMARAVEHADEAIPDWSDVAEGYVMLFARRGADFMGEDARIYAEEQGMPQPPDRRAWGGVLVRLSKRGKITRVGYAPNKDPKSHCSPKTVWRIA